MKRLKMRIIPKEWEIPEIEPLEYEDTEQFIDFLEEVRPYDGTYKEEISVAFIDGVRRTELACYIEDEESYKEGIFASIGVGGLVVKLGKVNFLFQSIFSPKVERFLVVKGKMGLPERISIQELNFNVRYANEDEPTLKVNKIMREELESGVAKRACENSKISLVVCDGPLSYALKSTRCIGFIKNIKKLYIRQEDLYILRELKKGQRTPIIRVGYSKGSVDKYTWYVKLAEEGDISSIVRLEMFSHMDEERVIHIANLTAGILPIFASKPYMDKRAPHNLVPIKSLEDALRAHLGHYSIVRNKILSVFNA